MKDRNSDEYFDKDFDKNFDESFDDPSHQSLLAFMKQNKPIAPSADADFEQRLFAEINKYPQRSPQQTAHQPLKRWLPMMLIIPTAIVALVSWNWINGRNQYQMATNQISDAEKLAIEQSLINSWNMTEDNTLLTASISNASAKDVQILQDLSPLEYE